MCGIPTTKPLMTGTPDYAKGKRLTFERCLLHIGGADNLVTANGRRLIDLNRKDFIWKYPEHGYCTYCGGDVGDLKAKHGTVLQCPLCGREVIFRHEARGHRREFDEFCLYEWRKSVLDGETVCLTAAQVWRNSTRDRPEEAPLRVYPSAVYVFRPGCAVTTYKRRDWRYSDDPAEGWSLCDRPTPDHTKNSWSNGSEQIVMDYGEFLRALRGTRIGATFMALNDVSNTHETLELTAVASCARRPWLEYLAKAGQAALAARLMRWTSVSRDIVPNPRARTPRELLGLTEAQWHETRCDRIPLTTDLLAAMSLLRRSGVGNLHMDEIRALAGGNMQILPWWLEKIAPYRGRSKYRRESVLDILNRAGTPEKLKRKAVRRILRDLTNANDWRDYYAQLHNLGEDMTDPALILPRDMPAMHQRMIDRENALKAEAELRELKAYREGFEKHLRRLRGEYAFEAAGLRLRPYESAREVIDEGQALHICIGSYAEGYMTGRCVICCLRRAEEPDAPFRAVEFSAVTGALVQDRGEHNDRNGIEPGTQKQLRLFWAAFERARKTRRSA